MRYRIYTVLIGMLGLSACNDLDLNPLSEGSTANWYSDESQLNMSLNDLYREEFWPWDEDPMLHGNDAWTDDKIRRNFVGPILAGTVNGE